MADNSNLKSLGLSIIKQISTALPEIPVSAAHEICPETISGSYTMPLNWGEIAAYQTVYSALIPFEEGKIVLPTRRVLQLKNVCTTWKGAVFKNLKIFIPSLVAPKFESHYNGTYLFNQWLGNHLELPGNVVFALVYNHWAAFNYYHWLIETLPRLIILRKIYPAATILLPLASTPYMRETVALLGFSSTLEIPTASTIRIPNLAFVEKAGTFLHQDPQLLTEVASTLTSQIIPVGTSPQKRIYVSRSRAHCRKVANESELLDLLSKYGFETIYFEDYSFTQQVKLMGSVEVIIGLHGANLTNILFMQEGALVIELMNASAPNVVYFQLASYLGLKYCVQPCMPVGNGDAHNDADVLVETSKIAAILNLMISNRDSVT